MTQPKRGIQRIPFSPPPPASELARRGLSLERMKRATEREDRDEAKRRAQGMRWAGRIAVDRVYSANGYWLFLVTKEAA